MECDIDEDGREIGRGRKRGEVRKRVPKSMQGPLRTENRGRENRFGGEDAKNTPVGS